MRTKTGAAGEPTSKTPNCDDKPVFARRRTLALAVAASGLVGIASIATVAFAERPEPINRMGRIGGCGWSDGYHACQSSGTQLLADLPPLSYTNRYQAARFTIAGRHQEQSTSGATYYDQFDQACRNSECDAVSAVRFDAHCDASGAAECDALDPNHRGIFGLRRAMDRHRVDPMAEQRRREQEELVRQKAKLAEEERQREYRVFEKYKVREEGTAATEGNAALQIPALLPEPILDSTLAPTVKAKSAPVKAAEPTPAHKSELPAPKPPTPKPKKNQDNGNWLPQRIPPESARGALESPSEPDKKPAAAPASEDVREQSPSDLPADTTSRLPMSRAEQGILAQGQLEKPPWMPVRLPPVEPAKVPSSVPLTPTMLPPVQAPGSTSTNEAQAEPAKRVASADSLIIRQPK